MVKKIFRKVYRTVLNTITGAGWYAKDLVRYYSIHKKLHERGAFYLFPKIYDKDPASHTFDKHYVYMDRWAFRHILEARPTEHVDVGSSIRFLSMASAASHLKFVDIRPVKADFDNFECIEGSVLSMPFADNSVQSLSCLHVAEHVGLGRYGDPLDPNGTVKACKELQRVLAPGGYLYFALPVGKTATYFNAHRVHNPATIQEYFSGLRLVEFSAVTDTGRFVSKTAIEDFAASAYACGMFKFTK